jgi:hypothetical protein
MTESEPKKAGAESPLEEEIANILTRIRTLEQARSTEDDRGYKQRQLRFNKWLTILTGCLVVTSLLANYVSKTASDAAKESAGAAARGVTVAQEAMKLNKESVEKTLAEMQVQSKAAQFSAEAAKLQASTGKKALESSIETSHNDQRAWVGMTEVTPEWRDADGKPLFIKEGSHYHVGVTIVNSGRTPALRVRSKMRLWPFPVNDKFVPDYGNATTTQSVGVLPPQAKMTITSLASLGIIGASEIASLKNGSQILYLYGEIEYEDIFGIQYQTRYCSTLAPTLDSFLVHSTYNHAD